MSRDIATLSADTGPMFRGIVALPADTGPMSRDIAAMTADAGPMSQDIVALVRGHRAGVPGHRGDDRGHRIDVPGPCGGARGHRTDVLGHCDGDLGRRLRVFVRFRRGGSSGRRGLTAAEATQVPHELAIGHAGTRTETRRGAVTVSMPGGSGWLVSTMTPIRSCAKSGASRSTSWTLSACTTRPGSSGLVPR
jgi:hypothetical protein